MSRPPSLSSASTTAITTGSSARNRNGGSIRLSGWTRTSSGQTSIISPPSEATPRISAERRESGTARSSRRAAQRPGLTSSTRSHGGPSTLVTCGANAGDSATHPAYRPGRDDLALGEHDHLVGDQRGELDVVGGDQHGPALGGEAAQAAASAALGAVVEAAGRLVEQYDRRAAGQHQREGEREPLPLGEVARVLVAGDARHERVEDAAACSGPPAAHSSSTVSR